MPGLDGIEAAHQITRSYPGVQVVMLSQDADEFALKQSIAAGAHGFLLKTESRAQTLNALRKVAAGQSYITPSLVDAWLRLQRYPQAAGRLDLLSLREREVYQMIVAGNTSKAIGEQMGIRVRTVEKHRSNLMRKLGLKTVAQLLQYAAGRK